MNAKKTKPMTSFSILKKIKRWAHRWIAIQSKRKNIALLPVTWQVITIFTVTAQHRSTP